MLRDLLEHGFKWLREATLYPAYHMGKYDPQRTSMIYPNVSVEPKLDGIRALAYKDRDSGKLTMMSRNGKEVNNAGHIIAELARALEDGYIFDGELYAGDWNKTMSITGSNEGNHANPTALQMFIFDMLTPEEGPTKQPDGSTLGGRSTVGYKDRRLRMLKTIRKYQIHQYAHPVERTKIKKPDDIMVAFKKYLGQGLEGGMIKAHGGGYTLGGVSSPWFKIKQQYSNDYRIKDATEGDGKYKGSLGNIIVDVNGVAVGVGTGFDDATRAQLWGMHQKGELVGKIAEVAFQEKSKAGALRFPVFVRLRLDKNTPSEDEKVKY